MIYKNKNRIKFHFKNLSCFKNVHDGGKSPYTSRHIMAQNISKL